MEIYFEKESAEIIAKLNLVNYCLDGEKVILYNVKKQFEKGFDEVLITEYIHKLFLLFEELINSTTDFIDSLNYRHAALYLNMIPTTPYWCNWVKAAEIVRLHKTYQAICNQQYLSAYLHLL